MRTSRRRFIKTAAAVAAAASPLGRLAAQPGPTWKMRYRPFGKTGLEVSEVALGGHYDGPGHKGFLGQEVSLG